MKVEIRKSKLSGSIVARPSKSYAHRYLYASCLSNNESVISNLDFSDDIKASLNCINAYGRKHVIDYENGRVIFKKGMNITSSPVFDCNESGTTLRIFMPIALQKYANARFIGSKRLIERGIDIYSEIFKSVIFNKDEYSITTIGKINSGDYSLSGNVSSQYISGLMYALPLTDTESSINITTELESKNYVDMTIDVLKKYQIEIRENIIDGKLSYNIKGNQEYKSSDFSIEGDYSNAAFIDAFNYLGSNIEITGLNTNSIQSDKIYIEYFKKINDGFVSLDISNCIDLGPVLITMAALKHGAKFTGTRRLKIKESDRGEAIASELRKCGAKIDILDNEIIVNKSNLSKPESYLDSHNDHRIAMSLSLLSSEFDIEIENSECVKKSYPKYFEDLKLLGASIS